MCGIAGHQGSISSNADKWLSLLNHRGPDAVGKYASKDTSLFHSRLSILDLSDKGNQPLPNEDKTLWLVFNGEIYNYQELRKHIEQKGHRFRSNTDSEVLLHLYEEYDKDMLSMLRGMFAFAIFDEKKEEIFLARDPFGIKPLVYSEINQGFVFASELRVLASLPEFPKEIDFEALEFYLRLNYIPAPWSIWKHAKKLRPGYFIRVKKGRIYEEENYITFKSETWKWSFEEAVEALREKLQESIRLHLVSDVSVGAFLSGGLDSSLVVALAQRALGKPLRTFTVTYPDASIYDESSYALKVAKTLGTDHTEIPIKTQESQEVLQEIVDHLDEPFADSSLIPATIISKITRQHVKVALSGDGGDEFFAGYSKYQGFKLASFLKPFSSIVGSLAKLPFSESRGSFMGNKVRQLRKLARSFEKDTLNRILRIMEVFTCEDINNLLNGLEYRNVSGKEIQILFEEAKKLGYYGINQLLYFDSRFVLPYDMLFKVDTASMRHSLEVRVPIIDLEVARLAFSFPESWKLHGFQRKWILRKVAEEFLPPEIVHRRKRGFGIPIGEWMRGDLYNLFKETLSSGKLKKNKILDPVEVEKLFREHMDFKRDRFSELWNLFVLSRWWEKNVA